ncbi:MAG TPA: hypothetical protein VLW49_05205, partial [Gaiellaceae bacterium]|nr:hypothetical protein [Gaiellaceae bacterium]
RWELANRCISVAKVGITMGLMLERAQVKALPVLNKAAEYAPTTQACCGVCRTCATTNVLALIGTAAAWIVSRVRRRP